MSAAFWHVSIIGSLAVFLFILVYRTTMKFKQVLTELIVNAMVDIKKLFIKWTDD